MAKIDKLRIDRKAYVKERLDKVSNKTTEMKRISKELFISVRTVERDYTS